MTCIQSQVVLAVANLKATFYTASTYKNNIFQSGVFCMFRSLLIASVIGAISGLTSSVDAFAQAHEPRVSFGDAVKIAAPAVVNIYAVKSVTRQQMHPFMNDPFFRDFFGGQLSAPMRKRVEKSLGSGVVMTKDGYIVTNAHVVEGSETVKVVFNDQREMTAEVISGDKAMDIAVLRIIDEGSEEFAFAEFGNSDSLEVGDVVLALGNPYGVGQSVSMGIVSAVGRSGLGFGQYQNFIQTDAAINPGSSGGALVDSNGKVVPVFAPTGRPTAFARQAVPFCTIPCNKLVIW
jgi:S1-C subfamily serine protease